MLNESRSIVVDAKRTISRQDTGDPPRTPTKRYARTGLTIASTLELGLDPKLHLQWSIPRRLSKSGYRLLIFRRNGGLSPVEFPEDLFAHGDLLLETVHNGSREERLPEGTYGFTFVMQGTRFFGFLERVIVVRFTETVPSARVPIGRLKDRGELHDLLAEDDRRPLEHEIKRGETELRLKDVRERLNPAPQRSVTMSSSSNHGSDEADQLLNAYLRRRGSVQRIKEDPKFKKLSKADREELLRQVEARLDPGDDSARR